MSTSFKSFGEFYPYYLGEHAHPVCRRLHYAGSALAIGFAVVAVVSRNPLWLIGSLLSGYAFAWIGHFFFEHNRPATFKNPLYSFAGDWVMWWQVVTGRIKF